MNVNVRFVGSLRAAARRGKMTLKLKKALPVKEAIEKIIEEHPKLELVLIDPELGDPRVNTLILVNGKDISILDGLQTFIKDGDELVFVSVVHGG